MALIFKRDQYSSKYHRRIVSAVTVEQVEVKKGSDLDMPTEDRRSGASDRRTVLILVIIATLFGLLAALGSMLLTGTVVKLVAFGQPSPVKVAIIAVGTTVGAAAAGWAAQPLLTRLAVRLAGYRLGRF